MDSGWLEFNYEAIVKFADQFANFPQLNLLIAVCVVGIYCLLFKQQSNNAELGGVREIFMVLLGAVMLLVAYLSIPMKDINADYIYTEFFANWGTELVFIAPWVMIKLARLMAVDRYGKQITMRNSLIFQLVMMLVIVLGCLYIVFDIEALTSNNPHLKLILLNLAVEGFTFPTTLLLIITVELILYIRYKRKLERAEVVAFPVMVAFYIIVALPFIAIAYMFKPLSYATIGGLFTIIIFVDAVVSSPVLFGRIPFRFLFYGIVMVAVLFFLSGLSTFPDLVNIGFSAELLGALIPFFLITDKERRLGIIE